MRRVLPSVLLSAAVIPGLAAQSNTVNGLDGNLWDISSPTIWGRRGPAFPGGEFGFSARNDMCNPGTVAIPWLAAMQPNHPKFGFMITRVTNGRMVQISDWSYIKHAFTSLNSNGGACLPCSTPGSSGTNMAIGCSDAYSAGNNGDRFWLGPPEELDPWLGTWNPIGSYFDRGDPAVAPPLNTDGVRSLSNTQISAFDIVKNRVTVKENEILAGASYFYQIHLVHQGEALAKRTNNLRSRGVSFVWNGTSWSTPANVGPSVSGSVLLRWANSTYGSAANGTDDGQIGVAVSVTGPVNGFWHYEYAVHNIDNSRGSAAFRLPVCSGARVQNIGFRDIDANPLNNWTTTVQGNEIAYLAAPGNQQRWNQLFNFWFDCDVAPVAGNATFDEATPGPGALQFTVGTQVPGLQPAVYLGAGCGTPASELSINGLPNPGNAAFALNVTSGPATPVLVYFSFATATTTLAPGCDLFLDLGQAGTLGLYVTDGSGNASAPIPLPPLDLYFQGGSFIPAPPVLGLIGLTNGLKVRFAGTGCN